jgi:hypothetical protein
MFKIFSAKPNVFSKQYRRPVEVVMDKSYPTRHTLSGETYSDENRTRTNYCDEKIRQGFYG